MKNEQTKETFETIMGTVLYGVILYALSNYLINYFQL
jgi:hypothetical protein